MKKVILGLISLVVLCAVGYIGWRMVFKGETFQEAIESGKTRVKARITPLREAEFEYQKGHWRQAVLKYKTALDRSNADDARENEKLTPQDRADVYRKIANSQYELAEADNWNALKSNHAIASYELLLKTFPELDETIREEVKKRLQKLRSMSQKG